MKDITILKHGDIIKCKNEIEHKNILELLKNNNYLLGRNTYSLNLCIRHKDEKMVLGYFYTSNDKNNAYQASDFLEEEFPEKWCIRTNRQEFFDWINNISKENYGQILDRANWFYYYPEHEGFYAYTTNHNKIPEITYEQFEKKFLNKKTNNIMKTTRKKLLSIRGKDTCSEFNSLIDAELKNNFQIIDEEEFELMKVSIDNIPRANSNQKELLKSIGLIKELDLFSITTYEEVCKALNERQIENDSFDSTNQILNKSVIKRLIATYKLEQIERLFNQNWKKDWNNQNQYKYYPYFKKELGGWVFCLVTDGSVRSLAAVAYYKDRQTAEYVGKTFINIYKDILE